MYVWADRTTTYRRNGNKLIPAEQGLFQECLTTYELITNAVVRKTTEFSLFVILRLGGSPEAIACVYFSQTKVCGYNNIGTSTGMSFSIAKGSFLA